MDVMDNVRGGQLNVFDKIFTGEIAISEDLW